MNQPPAISVLLPFYNSASYLSAAVTSVLQQTFEDLELLLLDDGSTDLPGEILASFKDPRIKYLRSERNLGMSRQLNRGIAETKGTYIARMDGDDIAQPRRLEKQHAFLEGNPEIGICGCYAQLFDDKGDCEVWEYPTGPDDVHACQFFRAPFLHPGVLIRANVLRDKPRLRYDEQFVVAQDFRFWHELLKHTRGANLPERLVRYRVSEGQLTRVKVDIKNREIRQIRRQMLEDLGLNPSECELSFHCHIIAGHWDETSEFFGKAVRWLELLYARNEKTRLFPERTFGSLLAKHFFFQCLCAARRGFNGLRIYESLSFAHLYSPGVAEKLRVHAKCLLKS